jgi:glucuronoarabinoxylan endo-1,4-beta-xylanase
MKAMKKNSLSFITIGIVLLLFSGHAEAQTANVNLTGTKQYIDGFGASTAWHGQISDTEANAGFSNGNNQLGLTILRIRIDPGGSSSWGDELANAQKAKARGAKILATPWSPPASMKTNGSTVGGELKTSEYGNYANWLNSFITYMANNSAAVDVISIQNEPNIRVDYESCDWNPTQMLNFCRDNAQSIGGNVMMPEAYNFDVSYSDPTLNDSTAASHISHIGGHLYGASPFRYTNAIDKGKRVWMTEKYFDPEDISTCLTLGKEILDCMANDMNAYVFWYLRQPNCNLINSDGSIKKKGYVMSHFSKFIRPGYYRVDATYNPQSGVYVTAYTGSGNAVLVAINQNSSSSNVTFSFSGGTVSNITKWETTSSNNLSEIGTYSGGSSFTNTLAVNSISTFRGTIGGGTTTTTAATTSTTTAATTTSTTATTSTTTTATSTTTTTATTTSTTAATTTTTAGTTTTTTAASTTTTASGQTCSPVDAAITAPFTKEGAGTFCWTATVCSYINSWNLNTLTVNGVNFTNTYASSSQLPAKIDGNWYIYYNGSYSWGHFELK